MFYIINFKSNNIEKFMNIIRYHIYIKNCIQTINLPQAI